MMKKFTIKPKTRDAVYVYFLGPHNDGYTLTFLYYYRIRKNPDLPEIILKMNIQHFFGSDENDVMRKANIWVADGLGKDFTVEELKEGDNIW